MNPMGLLSTIVHSILSIVSPTSSIHAPPLPPLPPLLSPPPPPPPPPPRPDRSPSSSHNQTSRSISSLSTTIGQVATNLSLALKIAFFKSPPPRKLSHHALVRELIASSPLPEPSSPSPGPSSKSVAIGVAIGVVVLLLVIILLGYFAFRRKKNHESEAARSTIPGVPNRPPPPYRYSDPPAPSSSGGFDSGASGPPPEPQSIHVGSSQSIAYDEVAQATGWFAESNYLGEGGFGSVYKGVLGDGREVAVKRLKRDSRQGEREFQAEVEIISRVHHRHLVSLVGWCITAGEKFLVYEFVSNKTLEFHLAQKGSASLDWQARSRIALGAAKGLAYLHEDCQPKIIHRDIKAANILLDHQFEAKVADFGMAKFFAETKTHISTRVIGTFGYLAPEYAATGKVTDRSDVFSFGVVLLELITGKRPILQYGMEESLVDWAKPLLSRALDHGKYDGLVDPKLGDEYDHKEMGRMVACAAACIRHSAKRRPRMSQMVRVLEGGFSEEDLFDGGVRPGHSTQYGYMTEMRRLMTSLTSEQGSASEQSSGSTGELFGSPPTGSGTGSRSQPSETWDMDSWRLIVSDSK